MNELDRMDADTFKIEVQEAYGHWESWSAMWHKLNEQLLMHWDDYDKAVTPEVRLECRRNMAETNGKLSYMREYAVARGGSVPALKLERIDA